MTWFRSLLCALAASVMLSACGDDNSPATTTTVQPTVTTSTTATPSTTATGEVPNTSAVSVPATDKVAYLTAVEVLDNAGADRVVFTFQDALPGYKIEYIQPPLQEDASGKPISLSGTAILRSQFALASGVNTTGGIKQTYTGPTRFSPPNTKVVTEMVRAGDFEANLTWGIGLKAKTGFKVSTETNPARVIIDFQ